MPQRHRLLPRAVPMLWGGITGARCQAVSAPSHGTPTCSTAGRRTSPAPSGVCGMRHYHMCDTAAGRIANRLWSKGRGGGRRVLSGAYRHSERMVQSALADLFGVRLCLGSVNRLRCCGECGGGNASGRSTRICAAATRGGSGRDRIVRIQVVG